MSFNVSSLFISSDSTLQEAISCIDSNQRGIALVVDKQQRLIGTIVDGDVRRALLDNLSLDTPVTQLLERKPSRYAKPVSAPADSDRDTLLRLMRERSVRQVPLVDDDERVVGLFTLDQFLPEHVVPLQAVVMAGGLGTRLRPLTEDLPKPMLPVGDRPLMEHIIKQLRDAGIHQVNVTTNYKAEKIEEYFGDGSAFGVELSYVPERRPLGTAGGIGLLPPSDEPLLVINGDILTEVDFRVMLAYHEEHNADLTVAVRRYDLTVPYGVVETKDAHVRKLVEKPSLSFFVNAGIYLLAPSVKQFIPNGERMDMTDLIDRLLENGRAVVSFPIREYWLDIGQHEDYVQAQEDVNSGRFGGRIGS